MKLENETDAGEVSVKEAQGRVYDCAVIGAGPAGLSAAVYLGRMRRSVVVIDDSEGRSTWHQLNRNYLGFPDGIHARDLRQLGREQAALYGAVFLATYAESVRTEGTGRERRFLFTTPQGDVVARTVILASGVSDSFPQFDGSDDCIGKSMFWCIICDGYETIDKRVVVLGHNERAAALCLELLVFTANVTLVSWDKPFSIAEPRKATLRDHGVRLYDNKVASFNCGPGGSLGSISLEGGTNLELDSLFVTQRMEPNAQLAKELGVTLDDHGFVLTDVELSTNVEGVYAAGDLTKLNNHQVSSAVHEGGMAAAAANYYLYEDWQKEVD